MSGAPTDNKGQAEPPLWSIGLAVLVIFVAPVLLYSFAPTGPLRGGDTIFSEGQQRVTITRNAAPDSDPQQDACLLDPGNPLIVIEAPADRTDGKLLAQVQGNQIPDWPFCSALTEVLLTPRQILQNPDWLRKMKDKANFLRP